MAKKKISYPFVPKSTAYLEPGHFWSIPLDGGGFACGRVIQLRHQAGRRDSRGFLAGLLDWSGDEAPSSEAIGGCRTIEQGGVHVKTLAENRGEILGFRPLEADGIEPWLFLSQSGWSQNCWVQRGFELTRPATLAEFQQLPVFSTWGYRVIKLLAEKQFGRLR